VCLALGALAAPLPARASVPFLEEGVPHRLSFAIVRNGDTIGTHTLTLRRSGAHVAVDIDLAITVRLLGLIVYSQRQTGREEWEGERMTRLAVRTREGSTRHEVEALADGESLRLTVDGRTEIVQAMPAATLWRPLPADTRVVVDPADGKPTYLAVAEGALESLTVQGRTVSARRWTWRGEINRDLWFDESGKLVQVLIKGDDGSDIFYQLQ